MAELLGPRLLLPQEASERLGAVEQVLRPDIRFGHRDVRVDVRMSHWSSGSDRDVAHVTGDRDPQHHRARLAAVHR